MCMSAEMQHVGKTAAVPATVRNSLLRDLYSRKLWTLDFLHDYLP
jgi:hypothetical protein